MRVSNVYYPPDGVANYAIMMMLMLSRRIKQIMDRAAVQDYSLKGKIGQDLSSSVVGVIGTGKIGTCVIRHLSGFGCRILAFDPFPNEEAARYAEYVSMDTLLGEADYITLHANATEGNYHLLDAEAFSRMKTGVSVVNTARGKLIDTAALIDALESGKAGGAALDVLEKEDGLYYYNRVGDVIVNQEMAVLRSFPNVILTPHTAFYNEENVGWFVKSVFESADGFDRGVPSGHEVV
jgi:D-lactate dehydrogenase